MTMRTKCERCNGTGKTTTLSGTYACDTCCGHGFLGEDEPIRPMFRDLSAASLIQFIESNCLQVRKSGYRWRDNWEIWIPASAGHYREEEERLIASAPKLVVVLEMAYLRLKP